MQGSYPINWKLLSSLCNPIVRKNKIPIWLHWNHDYTLNSQTYSIGVSPTQLIQTYQTSNLDFWLNIMNANEDMFFDYGLVKLWIVGPRWQKKSQTTQVATASTSKLDIFVFVKKFFFAETKKFDMEVANLHCLVWQIVSNYAFCK